MTNPTSWFLFAVFGLVLFVTYIAIRRRWASPTLVAALGVLGSIVIMTLVALTEGNIIYQAVFVGLLVGGLFSIGTLAMAWYFASSETRQASIPPDER